MGAVRGRTGVNALVRSVGSSLGSQVIASILANGAGALVATRPRVPCRSPSHT
ncbi:hypothetical protein [Streptomyces acidiscabies]|uniref:hypothetical protein n=1 Tax=Streptomyces acidiscabies TaxID=42234 RepID=UPI0038F744C4